MFGQGEPLPLWGRENHMLRMLIGPIKISKCPLWGFRSSFVRLAVQGSILDFVTAKKKKTKCQILWGKSDNKVVVTSFVMHNICDSNLTIFFSHHFFSIQTSKRKPMNLQTCKHPRIINAQHSKIPFLVKAFIRCKLLFLVS